MRSTKKSSSVKKSSTPMSKTGTGTQSSKASSTARRPTKTTSALKTRPNQPSKPGKQRVPGQSAVVRPVAPVRISRQRHPLVIPEEHQRNIERLNTSTSPLTFSAVAKQGFYDGTTTHELDGPFRPSPNASSGSRAPGAVERAVKFNNLIRDADKMAMAYAHTVSYPFSKWKTVLPPSMYNGLFLTDPYSVEYWGFSYSGSNGIAYAGVQADGWLPMIGVGEDYTLIGPNGDTGRVMWNSALGNTLSATPPGSVAMGGNNTAVPLPNISADVVRNIAAESSTEFAQVSQGIRIMSYSTPNENGFKGVLYRVHTDDPARFPIAATTLSQLLTASSQQGSQIKIDRFNIELDGSFRDETGRLSQYVGISMMPVQRKAFEFHQVGTRIDTFEAITDLFFVVSADVNAVFVTHGVSNYCLEEYPTSRVVSRPFVPVVGASQIAGTIQSLGHMITSGAYANGPLAQAAVLHNTANNAPGFLNNIVSAIPELMTGGFAGQGSQNAIGHLMDGPAGDWVKGIAGQGANSLLDWIKGEILSGSSIPKPPLAIGSNWVNGIPKPSTIGSIELIEEVEAVGAELLPYLIAAA